MDFLLIFVLPLVILLAIGGIAWESKTPEEKKALEEKWERERIEKRLLRPWYDTDRRFPGITD